MITLLNGDFTLPGPAQKAEIGHTWEVETQRLRLILVGKDKGSISGGNYYLFGAFGVDSG